MAIEKTMETEPRQQAGKGDPEDAREAGEQTPGVPAEVEASSAGVPTRLGIWCVSAYREYVSPALPPSCRYRPTCSEYTLRAIRKYGLLRGGWLGIKRICRCHPFHSGGHDPVP
jgi:putative membrane protein insertion efficiency factor